MTKIAIFIPSLNGGGAERVMVSLANQFKDRNFSVDLVLATAEGPYLSEVEDGVNVVNLGCTRVITSFPKLVKYLRKNRPEALLSALRHANLIAIISRIFAKVPTRIIVSERNHPSASTSNAQGFRATLISYLLTTSYRRADGIVAVSNGVADDLAKHASLPRESIDVVYNPVLNRQLELDIKQPAYQSWLPSDNTPFIIAAGRLTEQKGFDILIDAFEKLDKNRQLKLIILGDGPLRKELEDQINQLGLTNNIILPGFIDKPLPIMKKAHLFVLSSRWEGLPNVLIQAMACGVPVVATDCPSGPNEILENGRWGTLVPVGDIIALQEGILKALSDLNPPDVTKRASDFNAERAASEYLKVLFP